MGYVLRALIGQRNTVEHAARPMGGKVVDLAQGLALCPLTEKVSPPRRGSETRELGESFDSLNPEVVARATAASHLGAIGYFEAEFFGGDGEQATVVWRNGEVVLGPIKTEFDGSEGHMASAPQWAFNAALRYLGIQAVEPRDEFAAAELSRHRDTDDW